MARRTKEEAEQTKTDIIYDALDLFSAKGYSKTTFDDIAKHIGLTKGALYWHFRNKPDLLFELIRRMFSEKVMRSFSQLPANPGLNQVRDFFVLEAKEVVCDSQYRKFLFFVLFQMEWSEGLIAKVTQTIHEICSFPEQMIKTALTSAQKNGEIGKNVNIDETIIMIISLWKGLLNTELGENKGIKNFSEVVSRAFDIFYSGLRRD